MRKTASCLSLVLSGFAALFLTPGAASASLVAVFTGTTPNGALTAYHYDLVFTPSFPGEFLQAFVAAPAQSYITLYDFAGVLSAQGGTDFGASLPFTGFNPAGTNPADDSNVTNVVFSYIGATNVTSAKTFTGFTVQSYASGVNSVAISASQTSSLTGGLAGSTSTATVGVFTGVPEPGAGVLSLTGFGGLAGLAFSRRRRQNRI